GEPTLSPAASVAGKVIEHAKQVAIEVRNREFMQVPRLRLGSRNNPRLALTPRRVQLIDLLFALEIEPHQHGRCSTVILSKRGIGQEHSAVPFRDSCDPIFLATPIDVKAE